MFRYVLLLVASSLILLSCDISKDTGAGHGKDDRLRKSVQTLQAMGERRSFEKQWETARWIESRFRDAGLNTEIITYEVDGNMWPNVLATLPGIQGEKQSVMAIAHLDSTMDDDRDIGAPGADDDGSGVAVILEAAENMRGLKLRRPVIFAVFSREEIGHSGSGVFATLEKRGGKEILAVLNLDILGYGGPDFREDWKGVWKLHGVGRKIWALVKMTRNMAFYMFEGPRVLKVVGKPPNEKLVRGVAAEIRRQSGLNIKEVVRDDCG